MNKRENFSIPGNAGDTVSTLLHFMVHDLQCCLHVGNVERMMSLLDVRVIPGSPSYMLGMMNLHGSSIPVIDLGLRIGHPQVKAYTLETPIILCVHKGEHIGLVVTEILEVQDCEIDSIQVRPEFKQGGQPYEAVINTGHGLSLLLDIERIGGLHLGGADTLTRIDDVKLHGGVA